MILAGGGEGLSGTCFISATSFFKSPQPPPHLSSPRRFLPQASLFKFPCCQPTLAKRHSLPVSWLNCWRCLLLLGNPLRSFVPCRETQLRGSLCKPDVPSASFLPRLPSHRLIRGRAERARLLIDSRTLTAGQQW